MFLHETGLETLNRYKKNNVNYLRRIQPELIVADEPVFMIDVSLRTTIIDLTLNFRNELGFTYPFITHDLAIAKYISNIIAVMYLGKIIELKGEVPSAINIPSGCRFHPRCPYSRAECIQKEPSLIEIEKDHYVQCSLY